MNIKSSYTLFFLTAILLLTHLYHPRWNQKGIGATIAWDVSGYYMYLPAIFIYKDIKGCKFVDEILEKYHPTPDFQQAFIHEKSNNYVMKYSIGQAIQYSPFFFIAHFWASSSSIYPADGFSFPYQFMISMESLIIAFIGLYYLRKYLILYFKETTVSLTLLGIVFGSNYLNYAAIDGAMTHSPLFTIYAILIYLTILFYKNPTYFKSILIGLLVGMAALIRPTEILSFIIPVLWGMNFLSKESILDRADLFKKHFPKLIIAVICCILVGSIQLFYWKYVSGDWIVYSYQDQGFSWLKPHILNGIFSYRSGWLVYSPLMVFSLIGFYWLFKNKKNIFYTTFSFSVLFIYVAFSWDIWWYGGSFGQRTMVQAYPILAFPLSSFFNQFTKFRKLPFFFFSIILCSFCYINLWFTHQAHKGGLLHVNQMTKRYYWKTLGTFEKNSEHLKLLDTKDLYSEERNDVAQIYEHKKEVIVLENETQFSPVIKQDIGHDFDWIRVYSNFKIEGKELNVSLMTQFIVQFKNNEKLVKSRMIKIQRHLSFDNQNKRLFMDVRKPKKDFTHIEIYYKNLGDKKIEISDISVESFNDNGFSLFNNYSNSVK